MIYPLGKPFKETTKGHLYFIVSTIHDSYVAFSLSTFRKDAAVDEACVLQKGEHPFVRHRSFVDYSRGIANSEDELKTRLERNEFVMLTNVPNATKELVTKILDRARNAKYIDPYVLELVDAQYIELTRSNK